MAVVTHNEIINAIVLAENVAYLNAQARANALRNGETPCEADNAKAIEIEQWITILQRAEAQVENECITSDDVWQLIQKINEQYRGVDCDVSRTFSRRSSSGGGSNFPSGYVERVLGVNVDNSNPSRPVIRLYVDGVTITGTGTQADPLEAVAGGGTVVSVNGLTGVVVLTTTNIAEGTNQYFTTARVLATALTGLSVTGGTVTSTDTVLQAFGKLQNQINSLVGGVEYQGTWNASTNTPTLTSSVGTQGHYYVVSVAGSTNLNGITDWALGDWAIFNGTVWEKVDNTDAVVSVNGQIGAVSLGLQEITDVDNTTTNDFRSSDGVGSRTLIGNGIIAITTGAAGTVTIDATKATQLYTAQLPDKAAGTETFAMLSDIAVVDSWASTEVTGNLTAALSTQYINTANATYTDPSPTQAKGYQVYVRNGTATIGGVGYSVAGSVIWRVYHSGAWATYLILDKTANDALYASKTFVESLSLQDGGTGIAATTYTLELYAAYAYTINELKIIADAGTCTAAVKIN